MTIWQLSKKPEDQLLYALYQKAMTDYLKSK